MPNAVYDPEDLDKAEKLAPRLDDVGAEPLSSDEQAKLAAIESNFGSSAREPDDQDNPSNEPDRGSDGTSVEGGDDENNNQFNYHAEKKRVSLKERLTSRNSKIGAAVGVTIITGVTAFMAALPTYMMNGLRSLILEKLPELQTNQRVRYRRAKFSKISDAFTKDGRRGGRIIAEMQRLGYDFGFNDPTDGKKITHIRSPGGRIIDPDDFGEEISDFMERRHPLRFSGWKTKRMNAFVHRYGISRVAVVTPSPDDPPDPDETVNRNLANSIYQEDYDPRITGGEEILDDDSDEAKEAKAARNEANRKLAENNGAFGDTKEQAKTGKPLSQINTDEAGIVHDISDGTSEKVLKSAEKAGKGSFGSRAWSTFKGLSILDIPDKICTIKNRLLTAVIAGRETKALGGMKNTLAFLSGADAIRRGNGSAKLINSLLSRFTKLDGNGRSFGSSPAFAYALKGKFSKSKNDVTKSSYGVAGELGGTYKGVQDSIKDIPGTDKASCGVVQNPFVQIGVGAFEVVLGVFSGGTSEAAVQGTKVAITQSVKAAIKSAIKKSVAKAIAKSLIKSIAIELSFEGIMALTQMYAEKSMTFNQTGQEQGALLDGILIAGGGTANKQRSLQAGLVPATTTQYAAAHAEYKSWKSEQLKHQSFFARVFDISNPDSLSFGLLFKLPTSWPQLGSMTASGMATMASSIVQSPFKLFSSIGLFGGTAYAQEASDEIEFETYATGGDNSPQQLATDPAGNVLPIMRTDIESIDSDVNIELLIESGDIDATTLEPKSDRFKEHIKNCVEAIDILSRIEWGDRSRVEEDCLAELDQTKKFKAHLAYLDMVDSVDAEFFPEEIETGGTVDGGPNTDGEIDCDTVTGNEKIVCAAQTLQNIRYSNGSEKFKTEWGITDDSNAIRGGQNAAAFMGKNGNSIPTIVSTAFSDCSGFTNLSMYVAFGYQTTAGCSGYYVTGADPNIVEIPISDVRPGDFLTISRNCDGEQAGHIGIFVSKNADGTFTTLESSAGRNVNGEKKSGYYSKPLERLGGSGEYDFKFAARYIGPGSSP